MPLGDLGPTAARSEVITCKLRLEDALGKEVRSFAYPKGRKSSFAPWTREILAKAGYRAACTTVEGAVVPSSDPMLLPRIDVNGSDGRAQFAWKIEGQYDFLRWIRRWR